MIEDKFDSLENILKAFNNRFGNIDWDNLDKVQEILVREIPNAMKEDKSI